MEQTRDEKFVCKFCNKRYPCGKSLGGHIRTRMNNDNCGESGTVPPAELIFNGRIVKRVTEAEADGNGLREPKENQEILCFRQCSFAQRHDLQRMRKIGSFVKKQKRVMDSQSDTKTSSTPSKRRRSKRIRYRSNEVYSNNSVVMAIGSSSVSEIEQEQEEVAMCLMMLSRDSSGCCKKGLSSIADSSDNNSVILEAKSSSIDVKITIKNAMKQRDNKLKSTESVMTHEDCCNNPSKGSKYECLTCKKAFDSHRALGGHKANHTKANGCNEDSLENDVFIIPITDIKVTKPSPQGRALNNPRVSSSHFEGGAEDRTLAIKQDSPDMPISTVIDLNVPAPVEDDAMGNDGISPWEIFEGQEPWLVQVEWWVWSLE
ncbi:hypothetical protein F3Y22_tig00002237pilonHSYRG00079 [Hibiscus syriacus]|uniref:C2H2-type domain-containing protein n=1 Tax=Hibiscus syriacus TaxID=106335 RepID=A0A6A3CSP0_HIBSY|nr:hypothetical protein F3Y22_tig00002237pilonHSYRG00079 [Hibiscus syriacus]